MLLSDEWPIDGKIRRNQGVKILMEVGAHLRHPLGHQPLGGDHQRPSHQATELELAQDQPGLDGLAQPDFIGQEVTHAVAGNRPSQGTDLVG